jgi:hypothetical protein
MLNKPAQQVNAITCHLGEQQQKDKEQQQQQHY